MIIEENTTPGEVDFYEYLYYISRIQRRFITTKRRWFIVEELDDTNNIHAFTWFEEEGYLEWFQCQFWLADLAHDALYALGTPVIQN